ncbi:stau-1 [Pristionchus pacificus]|uniref:Stau-1 n=1 Tax=Pristionchus pacificus TaxID=54126 RepID=A0A2A6BFU3_PRIPA|nr:stau-1 [Pristionchus pacificus]|eukprot:PDM64785.1 stau-1 [Pristionchus pacificus]
MMVSISPNPDASVTPSALLSPSMLDPEDNIVLKPINVAESNDKMSAHPRFWCGVHENGNDNTKDVYNYGVPVSDKRKTPMCQIAELARFHKLKHEYQLMDESGPAHKKLFTVQLVLTPTQIFSGSGASIKKAQQSAAAEALRQTTLSKPPEKNLKKQKRNGDPCNPCVLLSHVCRRLGMVEPVYTMNSFYPPRGPAGMPPLPHAPLYPAAVQGMMAHYPPLTPKSIVSPSTIFPSPQAAALSLSSMDASPLGTCYLLPGGGLRPNRNTLPSLNAPTHMCTIVMASHPPVHAIDENKQEARNKAATQALCLLGPALAMLEQKMKEEKEKDTEKGRRKDTNKENVAETESWSGEENENEATVPTENPVETKEGEVEGGKRKKSKSVISQVHECALQMKLTVEFEVVSEEGRAHDRSFVVECRLLGGETVLQARGSGRQKREAKQAACAELIETLKKMESSPVHIATVLYKSQRRTTLAQTKEPKRKTIVKHMKMDPSYGHQINPVSRLIQVLQARGEPDPVFEFLGEAGQYKYKQFNVQVVVGDLFAEGAGPNKRLAKRAAAELMLELMGVAKRLPEPGKSLLKRREDDIACGMMNIGVFNPNDVIDAPPLVDPVIFKDEKIKKKKKVGLMWAEPAEEEEEEEEDEKKEPKRRVTFNAQVAACTAPDDHSYPMTEVAPLKADDLGCAGKARRRGREGRTRSLNDSQRLALGKAIVQWMEGKEEQEEDNVFRMESVMAPPKTERTPAKTKLDKLGTQFGFNPHYTIFPQGESANACPSSPAPSSSSTATASRADAGSPMSSSAAYFVIVNIPLNKAIMGEGHGATIDDAHEAAASDALRKIGTDSSYVPSVANEKSVGSPQTAAAGIQRVQQQLLQHHQQPNPYYNAFGGMPPSSPTARPPQQLQQLQQQHNEHLQYSPHRGPMTGMFPPSSPRPSFPSSASSASSTSPYDLPTMADLYGQFDAAAYGMRPPTQSAQQRPPSQRPYQYSNGV